MKILSATVIYNFDIFELTQLITKYCPEVIKVIGCFFYNQRNIS